MLKTFLLLGLLGCACVPARAAPPSSAMTAPELSPPEAIPRSQQVTTTYKCTGYYRSFECTSTLYLDKCRHSIKIYWGPLKIPGSLEWARKHRNWCSITYDGADAVEERKLEPEKCDGLMRLLAAALQGFPEVKWQDAACTHIGTPDGTLYVTQHWENPTKTKFFHAEQKNVDPEPKVIRLEDFDSCTLTVDKPRMVHCPVLTQPVHSWLRKTLAYLDVGLQISNPEAKEHVPTRDERKAVITRQKINDPRYWDDKKKK